MQADFLGLFGRDHGVDVGKGVAFGCWEHCRWKVLWAAVDLPFDFATEFEIHQCHRITLFPDGPTEIALKQPGHY